MRSRQLFLEIRDGGHSLSNGSKASSTNPKLFGQDCTVQATARALESIGYES